VVSDTKGVGPECRNSEKMVLAMPWFFKTIGFALHTFYFLKVEVFYKTIGFLKKNKICIRRKNI
jgi:hypothetical protein